jgi:hypothetical protein
MSSSANIGSVSNGSKITVRVTDQGYYTGTSSNYSVGGGGNGGGNNN